jgi:hypothetical protein
MKVTAIHIPKDTEIYKAIQNRRNALVNADSLKKAEKYLKYCKSTKDETLINYAEKLLQSLKSNR